MRVLKARRWRRPATPVCRNLARPSSAATRCVGVGYDDAKQWFIIRNSWGTGWGMKGYFTLPYAYVTDASLASDFWTMRIVQ